MEFHQNDAQSANLIKSISNDSITINETQYQQSCIISNHHIFTDLQLRTVAELSASYIEKLLASEPEIVILGSGITHEFPDVNLLNPIANANIGFEVMNNQSAARTYNILVAEERKVACLIIL